MGFFSGEALEQQLALADGAGVMLEEFHYDESTKKTVIRTTQDVEPYLEQNKKLYNLDDRGWSKSGSWRRVASIPNSVAMKWRNEEGIDVFNRNHWDAIRRKLNDPSYVFLRTAPGKI